MLEKLIEIVEEQLNVEGKEITINEPYVEVISDYYSKY